jgi:DNA-binding Lrp family transcriptional regulator
MLFVFKKYISNKSYTSSVDTMSLKSGDPEYENLISTYYGKNEVNAIITLKVDTKEVDKIATKISKFECIVDIYLVTGDTDIILKSKFKDYNELKEKGRLIVSYYERFNCIKCYQVELTKIMKFLEE